MNVSARHPQLTFEELQQLKWLLGSLLIMLSVSTILYMDVDAWALMAATFASVIASIAYPSWPARIPRWVHRLAFPFIVAFFTADLWLSGELLPAMVRLDLLLLLYRSFVYRQRRDDLQVIVLGLFLVIVAGVLTVSLLFALQILAFTALALMFLLSITLADAAAGDRVTPAPEPRAVPGWARHVEWKRVWERLRAVTDWRIVALGGALFLGLVALSALLFMTIPRFQLDNGLFLDRFISKKARSGFSDTIRFGEVTEIQQDNSVALSVEVSDRSQIPAVPYWRMLVLDSYHDGMFRLSPGLWRDGFDREIVGSLLRGTIRGDTTSGYWTFYLEAGVSRFLPLLGPFRTLRFFESQTSRPSHQLGIVALRNDPVKMLAYRVEGMRSDGAFPDAPFAYQWRAATRTQHPDEILVKRFGFEARDRTLVASLAEGIGGSGQLTVEEFIERASNWLAERHAYSLQPKIPAGPGDPLVRWLDSTEAGHCELFAGSLVVLASAYGLPARVVTGFRGGSWNGYSNNFTLRNSDAHAWCEIFDATTSSWVRADPTPGARAALAGESPGEAAVARRLDRSWRARLDSLRVFWYRRIVNFDQQSQFETLQAVKEVTEETGKQIRAWFRDTGGKLKTLFATPWGLRRIIRALAWVGLVATIAWTISLFRFSGFRFSPTRRRADEIVRQQAGRWLVRLRNVSETDATAAATQKLLRLRYGARETWSPPAEIFREARHAWRLAKKQRVAR
jgi:transglutaminase-like putative cysteine protease